MRHGLLKKLIPLPLLFSGLFVAAQQDSIDTVKRSAISSFHLLANAGLAAGASDCDVVVQAVAGMEYKNWFIGFGSGNDYYYLRSAPFFLEMRKHFQNPMFLFIYGDAGWNIPSKKNDLKTPWYTNHFKKGLYYEVGAGRQFQITRRCALLFSAGYCGKQLHEIRKLIYMQPQPNEDLYTTKIDYNLRRIVIKAGFQF